jgi:hypothetical protein
MLTSAMATVSDRRTAGVARVCRLRVVRHLEPSVPGRMGLRAGHPGREGVKGA